ncbi:MAG: ribonuclease E/G [Muribaculaceae bacterium]|nr:ribonuclease E/G [Roseburia sp.]MCM1430372.1 ribonuclease E/G [Muribaculaceae bacterium]MCM1492432.1 ribonuclease E/G [Muribaculaceae bacterium]
MNRVVITELTHQGKRYIAYIVLNAGRELVELQVFVPEEDSVLNHIYVGYVEKVAENVHAAFLRIGEGRKCYLPLRNLVNPFFAKKQSETKPICEGDELIVQVVKEAVKTKEAEVSTALAVHGTYCIVTTDNTRLGVSHKLPGERAQALLELAEEICGDHEAQGYGLVIRTNAGEESDGRIQEDIRSTVAEYERIRSGGVHQRQGSLLYRNLPGYLARLKGQRLDEVDRIYTDVPRLYEEISSQLPAVMESEKLVLYEDDAVSLSTLYNLRGNIEALLRPTVWLPSGANIIIETLETLTVIDVNSGKNTSRKESALFSINLEAAREIARQLRLRNISGIIVVDFINMKSEEQQKELIACLKQELSKDSVPARFVDITKLGLVEITRRKGYRSLQEIFHKKS